MLYTCMRAIWIKWVLFKVYWRYNLISRFRNSMLKTVYYEKVFTITFVCFKGRAYLKWAVFHGPLIKGQTLSCLWKMINKEEEGLLMILSLSSLWSALSNRHAFLSLKWNVFKVPESFSRTAKNPKHCQIHMDFPLENSSWLSVHEEISSFHPDRNSVVDHLVVIHNPASPKD